MRVVLHFFKVFIGLFFLKFPIKKKTVCFDSFGGQYNDNPKYISEELHKQRPDIIIVWNHTSKSNDIPPAYVRCIDNGSILGRLFFYSSQVVVDNHTGIRSGMCPKYNKLERLLYKVKNKKRKGQLNISTFHGTPLKHIAMDEPHAREKFDFFCSSNYVLSGCKYTTENFISAFDNKIEIREYGTPRNDILINDNIDSVNLKERLGLPKDKKIVLFAPTFRNSIYISGVMQMQELNIKAIVEALKEKFEGDWCFVFRAHNLVQQNSDIISIYQSDQTLIINGNAHDDMAEYLKCADILITDYSASMFDYALTRRPCFLFTPDLQEYANSERGFYLDIMKLPFPLAKTNSELLNCIKSFNHMLYEKQVDIFLLDLGNLEDGSASKRVVKDIIEFIDKK